MLTFRGGLQICSKLLSYYMAELEETWGYLHYKLSESTDFCISGVHSSGFTVYSETIGWW